MDFDSVLCRIEEQKKDEYISAQLFRYIGLIHAIDFFSQKLNFEQIADSGFDFVNELLGIEKSAVFVRQGDSYVLKKIKGDRYKPYSVSANEFFRGLATRHGTLLCDRDVMERFFQRDLLEAFQVETIIPLIIENTLYGFILISGKKICNLNHDEYIIAECLMKLINSALENYERYEELQKANGELDEKIFNLFAINQSSKLLLSELNLEVLYTLSVDVFSELTQNTMTGFVLYDPGSEKFVLKAYKDIFYRESNPGVSLTVNNRAQVDENKIFIKAADERDVQYFNSLFLVEYRTSMSELIESLASATYTAVSNARLFETVNEQKKVIQGKLEKLVSLNNLMKNINSSTTVDNLLDITLKTLDISFNVEKALLCLYDKERKSFVIRNTLNIETDKREIKPNRHWKRFMEGDSIAEAREEGGLKYINQSVLEDVGESQGVLLIPIYIDRIDIEILGAILIFKCGKALINDEENLLTFETIAGHTAPVLSNLSVIEEQKRFLLPNYIETFKSGLKYEVAQAVEYSTDLTVVQVCDSRTFAFKNKNFVRKLQKNFSKVYPFSYNNIFVIIQDRGPDVEARIRRITGVDGIQLKVLEFRKDFKSCQEFFKLF